MTGHQMMEYYGRPQHLYSHGRTCTRRILCRIISRLVAFHICYLPVFMRSQLSWLDSSVCQISSSIMEILIHCISSYFMEIMILCISSSWIFRIYLYCLWRWPHMSYFVSCLLIMAIVLLCIRDCCMYLQSYVEIFVLYCWMAGSSTWFFITPLLGWTYIVFRPSYHPSNLTH